MVSHEHGHGERQWTGTGWSDCIVTQCDPGFEPNNPYNPQTYSSAQNNHSWTTGGSRMPSIPVLPIGTGGNMGIGGDIINPNPYTPINPGPAPTECIECSNRIVNGEIAVSSYAYECEIATCMYHGQKYILENNECIPICENETDETGTKHWDERTRKCVRTCNPGYKMW